MRDARKERVFKSVKWHLNELKRLRPQYEWVMIAHQGSYNYNLDLFTEDYKSDVDTIAIVLPSFEDFVENKSYISETLVLDNNEHIDVKDIRLIVELFKKQNIKYLEILHTEFRIINPKYKDIVIDKLLNQANSICRYDITRLVTCTFGMAKEKEKALEHPYEGLKDKIAKYGYDGKQLHHIIRLLYFLGRYIDSNCDFKFALNSHNYPDDIIAELDFAKMNKYSLEEARELSKSCIDRITQIRQNFIDTHEDISDKIDILLDSSVDKIFKCYFKDMFMSKEVKKNNIIKIPTMEHIFVTSDLHFGHENILDFEDNRWELCGTTFPKALISHIKDEGLTDEEIRNMPDDLWDKYSADVRKEYIVKHDEGLIQRWNETITDKDLVFILGDFSFRNGKETNEILKRLNGRKILILGNHDNIFMDKDFDKSLFEEITIYKEINVDHNHIVMMHYPIQVWNKKHKGSIHLYGHVHSNTTTSHPMKNEIPLSYNVGVDVNGFRPVRLDIFIKTANFYRSLNK